MDEHPSASVETTSQAPTASPRSRAMAGLVLVLVLVAPGLLVWSWSQPIAAPPREMPPLILEPSAVAEQLARDTEHAAAAPTGEAEEERRRLVRELNVAEQEGRDPPGRAEQRRERLQAAVARLVAEHGADVLGRVRASDLARLEPALRGSLPSGDRVAELGGFVAMMERYDLVRDGRQVAPRFVVRTLFKARWNAIHGRELTEGLSDVELQAYWGWLALGAVSAPIERRLEGLERHVAAGGTGGTEARAVLLFDQGNLEEAREAFEDAWTETGSFRLRNHALSCASP